MQWAVHTSIAFSILGGIVLTVVGIGCSRWMLDLMSTPDDVVNHALIYNACLFPWNHREPDLQHGFRYSACGRRFERPLLYLIICCMTNIALRTFICCRFADGCYGRGACDHSVSDHQCGSVMGSLMRTRDIYRLHLRKISIDWIMLKRIIRIGFPAAYSQFCTRYRT